MIKKRSLGASGLSCLAIGLGCAPLSGVYGTTDDEDAIRVVRHALDRGIDYFDTAFMYGHGHNEALLGRAFADGRRNGAIIATKFGQYFPPKGVQRPDGLPDYAPLTDCRPETVIRSAEVSLQRLKISEIDLYYAHRVDPKVPIEDTVGAMKRLVEQGKVRALGLSEASPASIRSAHAVHPIAAVQMELSLLYHADAIEVRKTTSELGISLVAYSPLARGLLTGTVNVTDEIKDARGRLPAFSKENIAKNLSYVERVVQIARENDCSPAQLALAWVLAQGDDVIAIPGTRNMARIDENLGALDVRLNSLEVAQLTAVVPSSGAAGERYPPYQMADLKH